jgi:hypothetical protein
MPSQPVSIELQLEVSRYMNVKGLTPLASVGELHMWGYAVNRYTAT